MHEPRRTNIALFDLTMSHPVRLMVQKYRICYLTVVIYTQENEVDL